MRFIETQEFPAPDLIVRHKDQPIQQWETRLPGDLFRFKDPDPELFREDRQGHRLFNVLHHRTSFKKSGILVFISLRHLPVSILTI